MVVARSRWSLSLFVFDILPMAFGMRFDESFSSVSRSVPRSLVSALSFSLRRHLVPYMHRRRRRRRPLSQRFFARSRSSVSLVVSRDSVGRSVSVVGSPRASASSSASSAPARASRCFASSQVSDLEKKLANAEQEIQYNKDKNKRMQDALDESRLTEAGTQQKLGDLQVEMTWHIRIGCLNHYDVNCHAARE